MPTLTYYHYHLARRTPRAGQEILIHDLSPLLRAYCNFISVEFKKAITYGGEHLVLLPTSNDRTFIFVATKENEIIKTLKASDYNECDDLSELFKKYNLDASAAFAAYIYVEKKYFGIASTTSGPTARTFGKFLAQLLRKIGAVNTTTRIYTLGSRLDLPTLLAMPFIGSSTLEIKSDAFTNKLKKAFVRNNSTLRNTDHLKSFRLQIVPETGKEGRDTLNEILEELDFENDVLSLRAKAKEDLSTAINNYHIKRDGKLSKTLSSSTEGTMLTEIRNHCRSVDTAVTSELDKVISQFTPYPDDYEHKGRSVIRQFENVAHWNSSLCSTADSGPEIPEGSSDTE